MTGNSRVPWLALGIPALALLAAGVVQILHGARVALPPCPMKSLCGIPCVTCGLTRCAMALSEGRWAEAFHWHPVAILLGLASPFAMGWDLRRAWRGKPCPSLPDSPAARLAVAGLLLGTWLLQIVRGI